MRQVRVPLADEAFECLPFAQGHDIVHRQRHGRLHGRKMQVNLDTTRCEVVKDVFTNVQGRSALLANASRVSKGGKHHKQGLQ